MQNRVDKQAARLATWQDFRCIIGDIKINENFQAVIKVTALKGVTNYIDNKLCFKTSMYAVNNDQIY